MWLLVGVCVVRGCLSLRGVCCFLCVLCYCSLYVAVRSRFLFVRYRCLLCDVVVVRRLWCVVCACCWSAMLLLAVCALCVGCLGVLVVLCLLLCFGVRCSCPLRCALRVVR